MYIEYHCRHCGHCLGKLGMEHYEAIQSHFIDATEEEKQHFLYQDNDRIHVMAICENCHDTLEENPHYYEYDTFLQ